MEPEAYKFVNTHGHEISGCTILSILIHKCVPCLGGMNYGVRPNLATLKFNNGEQLEYIQIIILRLQH